MQMVDFYAFFHETSGTHSLPSAPRPAGTIGQSQARLQGNPILGANERTSPRASKAPAARQALTGLIHCTETH